MKLCDQVPLESRAISQAVFRQLLTAKERDQSRGSNIAFVAHKAVFF
jgi:hypothetical protein